MAEPKRPDPMREVRLWSGMLDREHKRCFYPSRVCREVADLLLDALRLADAADTIKAD